MDMEEETGENMQESVAPEGPVDYAQGYMIAIHVKPSGFCVYGPSPLPQGEMNPGEEMEPVDLADALKHVIAITKENPLDTDEAKEFDAGYAGQ